MIVFSMDVSRLRTEFSTSPGLRYALLTGLLWVGFLIAGSLLTLSGPVVPDEFAYLFSAKLFASGRLAAAPPPYPEHFETLYVLTTPSWASRYPPLQSAFLATGLLLGHPLLGVWLSCAAWGSALHWMFRAVVSRTTSAILLGAWFLFFACGHYWTFSFWGGSAAACCGTLVLGSGLRMARGFGAWRDVVWWFLGCVGLSFSRPLEGAVFVTFVWIALLLKIEPEHRRSWWALAGCTGLLSAALNMGYNAVITGHVLEFPYALWESRYQRVPLFVWQSVKEAPHAGPLVVQAVREGILDFRTTPQVLVMAGERVFSDLRQMLGLWFVWPMILILPRWRRMLLRTDGRWWTGFVLLAGVHLACIPYFPHYGAPFAGLFWLVLAGLFDDAFRMGSFAMRTSLVAVIIAAVLASHFPRAGRPHAVSEGVPDAALMTSLTAIAAQSPEPMLIFVEVTEIRPSQAVFCGLYNEPDLDAAHAIYVWDGGAVGNERLIRRFPGRRVIRVRLASRGSGLTLSVVT